MVEATAVTHSKTANPNNRSHSCFNPGISFLSKLKLSIDGKFSHHQ
jgi:hypothetical protein